MPSHIWVYEYKAWRGYLIQAVAPHAVRLEARLDDYSSVVLSQLLPEPGLFLFHINLTYSHGVPQDRQVLLSALRAKGVSPCNHLATDISKRAVQRCCIENALPSVSADENGDPDEMLIIKTNFNFGGLRESELTLEQFGRLGYRINPATRRSAVDNYVLRRRSEIPPSTWESPHWVVERYVSNRNDTFFRTYAAGNAMVVSQVTDPAVFKKMPEGIPRSSTFLRRPDVLGQHGAHRSDAELVAALAARVGASAGIEFGAFDTVLDDDGNCYVIDINTTPYWGDGGHPDIIAYLRSGLTGLCP